MFTDEATKDIARIAGAWHGSQGARGGGRGVLEGVMFEPEPGVRYVITGEDSEGGRR